MTKATKQYRMPGKERPAASQLGSRGLPRRSLTIGMLAETRNPPPASPSGQTAEGLDYRFLRSQPRVIGPGSLRKARPRRSDYNTNTQSTALNINAPLLALQSYTPAR